MDLFKLLRNVEGFLELGMHEDAIAELDAALAEHPGHEPILHSKAISLLSIPRYADAEACFQKLLEVNAKNIEGWIHLAYCRRRTTSLDAAVSALQRALDLDASHPMANYNMACYRALQGKHAEALRLLEKAIQKDPCYGQLARAESDFDSIRSLPSFQSLLGGS